MGGWNGLLSMSNLPFVFVESALTRKYSKMEPLSRNSLMKYLRLLTAEVEKMVLNELPEKFGIVIDGWSEGNRHYIAVFACYDLVGKARMTFLSIAPPFEEKYDAASHQDFIVDVLSVYGKGLTNLLFLVGDNAPVNKSIANLLVIPFIGCASHRFNLACKKYLGPFENNLINDLMITYIKSYQTSWKTTK